MSITLTLDLLLQFVVYAVTLGGIGMLVIWRIGALEKKVEKHNGMIERMYKAETKIEQHENWLSDIEKKVH